MTCATFTYRVVEQILSLITNHDLQGLRDLWQHLNSRLFKRLDSIQTGAVSRLESGVLKLYVVNCVQTKNHDKLREFFEKMASELQGQPDWKEWFALAFISNPESNPAFVNYFGRSWQDSLMLSLHNFLAIVFASLPPPKLGDYHSTMSKMKRLRDENDAMRQTLLKQHQKYEKLPPLDIPRPTDVMDDFYIIASHDNSNPTENQSKGLKGFLRNITGAASVSSSASTTASVRTEKSRSSSRSRTPSTSSIKTAEPRHAPVKRLANKSSFTNLISETGDPQSKENQRLAYLLLGQEEYLEHHSEVTQCKFSSSGYTIASCDTEGVVKVWSASPGPPQTHATYVSPSGVTALDWVPNSDQKFLYGTMNGMVRICDKDERKSSTEFHLQEGNNPFINHLTCSSTGNLCAIASETSPLEGYLSLYDLRAGQIIEPNLLSSLMTGLQSTLSTCVFNHNAQMVITGSTDGKVRIFDLRKRDCISSWSLENQAGQVLTLQMSQDETSIYALNSNGQFSAWSFIQTSQKLFEANLQDPYFDLVEYPRAAFGKSLKNTNNISILNRFFLQENNLHLPVTDNTF